MTDLRLKQISSVWYLAGLHLAIVLPLAFLLNLWLDEAWTMRTTALPFGAAITEAVYGERQAPLYFVFLTVWRKINDSLFFARFFSICCTIVSIFVFDRLAAKFLNDKARIFAVTFFAVHPFLIWTAVEARVYALIVLFSGLLILLWHRGYVEEDNNNRRQTLYILLAVAALYTNYYLGFLLVANAAALVVLRRWNSLKHYLWQMIIVAICLVPLVFILRRQFSGNTDYVRLAPSLLEGARLVWQHFNAFVLPAESDVSAILRLWIIRFAILALVVFLIKNKGRELKRKTAALFASVGVVMIFLLAGYFLLGEIYLEIRHAAPLFVLSILLFAAILNDFLPRRFFIAAMILPLVFSGLSLAARYSPLAKRGDWARIANFIKQNEQSNEPIAIFRAQDALPFRFYYDGRNEIAPPEIKDEWNSEDAPETETRWKKQIEFIISAIPESHEQLWLVTEDRCADEKSAIECQPLEDFVERNYVVERSENFYTRRVRLLRRKPRENKNEGN